MERQSGEDEGERGTQKKQREKEVKVSGGQLNLVVLMVFISHGGLRQKFGAAAGCQSGADG